MTNACGKLLFQKLCGFRIKTPFLYHENFASRILPRGWGQAAGPTLLFGRNSTVDLSGQLVVLIPTKNSTSHLQLRLAFLLSTDRVQ